MSSRITVVAIAAFVFEVLAALYLTVFAWLGSSWMADDSWAVRATDADWVKAAVVRFATWCLIAAFFAFLTWVVNWWLATKGAKLFPWAPKLTAAAVGVPIVVASAIGAVQFVIERPWM